MQNVTLKDLAVPLIKSIDSFNYLLKSHHRRTGVISYMIGKEMGLTQDELTDLVLAASLHDIGALSVQERDTLIVQDVEDPNPHCIMGFKMLRSFEVFKNIAMIIKHHHIKYGNRHVYIEDIPIQSYIIHLADRVDIKIDPNRFILDHKQDVIDHIEERTGEVFNPDVFKAFMNVCKSEIFWININNMTMDQLLDKIDYTFEVNLNLSQIVEFGHVISRIVDYRSHYTAAHSFTVAHIAHHIGKIIGMSKEDNIKLLVAGLLHDIGKISIDPGIIEKKGPLTDSEYNQIKLHSYYSGQILNELNQTEWFQDIVTWAKNHHEKLDGAGYPLSLQDEEIDRGTRIITISDILAALMEDRPYRNAMSIESAFDIIEQNSCKGLCKDLVDTLRTHKEDLNQIILFAQKEARAYYSSQYSY